MADPKKYTHLTVGPYYDPELQTNGVQLTAWTDEAWNRQQDLIRRYLEDLEWQRNHPYLAWGRRALGNVVDGVGGFINDEILLNRNNIRVRNALAHPEAMNAVREGGNIAGWTVAAPFLAYTAAEAAPLLWSGGKGLFNIAGRAMMPSEWASGLAQWFPRFAPQLQTAGQLGNATMASYLAAPGLTDVYEGIRDGDSSKAWWGGARTAMSIPYLQEMRPLATLGNGYRAYSGASPSFGEALAFSPTSRLVAGTTAMAMPFAAAANTPTLYLRNEAGELVFDENGNPIPVDLPWYQNTWNWIKENPSDAAILAYGTYLGGRGLYNRTLRAPRRYSVTENGTTVKRDRPVGQRPGAAPEYQPVDELPQDRIPQDLVYPEHPNIPSRPTLEDFGVLPEPAVAKPAAFSETLLPDPGPRPTSGKKLLSRQRRWDKRNQQYQDQQARLQEYNTQNAEAELAWNAYESPEQVEARARFDLATADYNAREPEYQTAWNDYVAAQNTYNSRYDLALTEYNNLQRTNFPNTEPYTTWQALNRAWTDYEASPEYTAWLRRKQWPSNAWQFVKDHKVGVGLGAWWLGNKLFGGNSPAPVEGVPTLSTPALRVDTIGVVPGVRRDSVMNAVTDSLRSYGSRESAEPELADDED